MDAVSLTQSPASLGNSEIQRPKDKEIQEAKAAQVNKADDQKAKDSARSETPPEKQVKQTQKASDDDKNQAGVNLRV